ncbi:MAG: acyl-CoA dehydrogenase family protein [Leptolyngbya sp. BL-A-14]
MHPNDVLTETEAFLRKEIAPQAMAIDRDPEALLEALRQLGDRNLLALRVPQRWSGAGVDGTLLQEFNELLARYSGSLAFLQAQHQSAGSLLMHSDNEALKEAYLPLMGTGKALVGISFAHLRREQPPLKAIAVDGGYQLTGEAPWITGWGFFQTFIAAAVLPDGQAVYGMVPLQTTEQNGGAIVCSEPLALAAMNSTNTVTAAFKAWFLPHSQVVCLKPASAVSKGDRANVLHHSFFALGCARAGVDILATIARVKQQPFIQTAYEALDRELAQCRNAIRSALVAPDGFDDKLRLRAWAIELAVRCAHAAVTASSGAANSMTHPAQRVYREALTFTVSGQTTAVMAATLARLVKR